MYRSRERRDITVKERTRDEINAQIQEFLKRGGQIDILHPGSERVTLVAGANWQDRFETPELPD